jgi:hypothetical protein
MTRPDKISPAAFRQVYQEVVPDPADRSGQSGRNHRLGDNLKVQFEELHLPEIERQTFRLCYNHQIRNSLLQVKYLHSIILLVKQDTLQKILQNILNQF